MSIKKFGLALSLFAAFGLMACGDDSSSGSSSKTGDNKIISCKFTPGETSFKSVTTDGDTTATVTGKLEEGVFTFVYDGPDTGDCEEDAEDADEGMKVECKNGREIITQVVEGEEEAKMAFDESKKDTEEECKETNGKTKAELDDEDVDEGDDEGGVACDEDCQNEEEMQQNVGTDELMQTEEM